MAKDSFAELGLERRLSVPELELRACYDARCREVHPDSGGKADDFQRLQDAYGELSALGPRLRHWLALGGVPLGPGGALSPEVDELFGRLGLLLQRAEEVSKRQSAARSALARSIGERQALALLSELEAAREETTATIERLGTRFAEFDERGVASCGEEASVVARSLLFLEKWEKQLRAAWSRMAG